MKSPAKCCAFALSLFLAACGDPPAVPYSSAPPYASPVDARASVTIVVTCGESLGPAGGESYRFPGVPDGMGLLKRDGKAVLFVNHEFPKGVGPAAGPLYSGARISELVLDDHGKAIAGRPVITEVWLGEPAQKATAGQVRIAKLCSGFMAGEREGFDPPMFLAGEESSGADTSDGRGGQAFALANGAFFALPGIGRAPWEDLIVLPNTGSKTAVVCLEDSPAVGDGMHSELYLYVGEKSKEGDPPARNGLRGGKLFTFVPVDPSMSTSALFKEKGRALKGRWAAMDSSLADAALEAASDAAGAFRFVRIEDGAPDPSHPGTVYFATTGRPGTAEPMGRVWKLDVDVADPAAGGTLTIVLDGTEGIVSPDNVDVNAHGELAICEDPVPSLESLGLKRDTSVWVYEIESARLTRVLEMARGPAKEHWVKAGPGANVADKDEDHGGGWEFSGIVDAEPYFGRGAWLLNAQAHSLKTTDGAVVQGGQILKLVWKPEGAK
ncbi:MAG: PhoX family protein [Planctomycetes bacterium]|nr:PhoX family protein [Planctomycetota bacterium]